MIFHSNVELPEGIVQYGHRQLLKFIAMQYQRTTKRDLNNAHVCLTYDIAYSKMHLRLCGWYRGLGTYLSSVQNPCWLTIVDYTSLHAWGLS